MKTANDLKLLLRQADHKSYPAYKNLRGSYQMEGYQLNIEQVQGDPFASPSKISVWVPAKAAVFPKELYSCAVTRTALEDQLLREFARKIQKLSYRAKGSGKSGLLHVTMPGQEVLQRSGCTLQSDGSVLVRMEAGFPANGRTTNARELEKMLFEYLGSCVKSSLYYVALDPAKLRRAADLAEDQQAIREQLKKQDLVAFIADGAILPRASGVSNTPLKKAVPFKAPESLQVTMQLPHRGTITGMGIRKGLTLIVGGGYHGKSTLLKALETGIYNHAGGDGREYVITDESAVKLRAEDGRSIWNTDISLFINHLPNGTDTTCFSTEDASGSTSQAAGTVEAMQAGSKLFLIDEDTSATNFMIRDELMQRVVSREEEPITPFIDRVEELYKNYGISTILVAGSSGSYFHKADCVIQMKEYMPADITAFAKEQAKAYPLPAQVAPFKQMPDANRIPPRERQAKPDDRLKIKTMGRDGFVLNRETVDLRYVEQIVTEEQMRTLAYCAAYARRNIIDGKRTLTQIVAQIVKQMEKDGFAAIVPGKVPGNLAAVRSQEIYACLNRMRSICGKGGQE